MSAPDPKVVALDGELARTLRDTLWEAFDSSERLERCTRQDASVLGEAVEQIVAARVAAAEEERDRLAEQWDDSGWLAPEDVAVLTDRAVAAEERKETYHEQWMLAARALEAAEERLAAVSASVLALADFVEEIFEGCEPGPGCAGCEAVSKAATARVAVESTDAAAALARVKAEALREFAAQWDGWRAIDAPQTRGGVTYRLRAEATRIEVEAGEPLDESS